MKYAVALAFLLLAACSKAPETAANEVAKAAAPETPAEPAIVLLGDGLRVEAAGQENQFLFGITTIAEAEKALVPIGQPKTSQSSEECPTGQLDYRDWPNHLQLAFQNGRLVGWWAFDNATAVASPGGIRPGSPRSALGKTEVTQASFGNVFTLGAVDGEGVNGLLDEGKGTTVGAMWAGAACIFD